MQGPTTDPAEIRAWAEEHGFIPAEQMPDHVDSEPALLRLVRPEQATVELRTQELSWEEFFKRFETLGLAFVYGDDNSDENHLLQEEERSPYRPEDYKPSRFSH